MSGRGGWACGVVLPWLPALLAAGSAACPLLQLLARRCLEPTGAEPCLLGCVRAAAARRPAPPRAAQHVFNDSPPAARPSPAPPAPPSPAVYQASDYCDIMEHLIQRWDVEHREGLRGDAAEAQARRAAAAAPPPRRRRRWRCLRRLGRARAPAWPAHLSSALLRLDHVLARSVRVRAPPTPTTPTASTHRCSHDPQEYLMKLPARFRKLSERAAARKAKTVPARVKFSWIFEREVQA